MPPFGNAPTQSANVYDLTANESASLGIPHDQLLIDVFKAIAQRKLHAHFDESPSTVQFMKQAGMTWLAKINEGITALERNPHFFVRWFRSITIELRAYRNWRDETQRSAQSARSPSRRASEEKVLRGMKSYVQHEQKRGRETSQKRAWEWAKANMPDARHRQVMSALLKIEGRKKERGRPRARG